MTNLLVILANQLAKPLADNYLFEPWMIIPMLLVIAGMAWLRVNYPRRIGQLLSSFLHPRLMQQMMREELVLLHRGSVVLSISFLIIFSLAAYELVAFFYPGIYPGPGWMLFLIILGVLSATYILKTIGIFIFKGIVEGDYHLMEYNFSVYLYNKLLGLLLLPLTIILATTPLMTSSSAGVATSNWSVFFTTTVIVLIVITYLTRLVRSFISAYRVRVPLVYIIFYLCTLEILPLAIVIKLLQSSVV